MIMIKISRSTRSYLGDTLLGQHIGATNKIVEDTVWGYVMEEELCYDFSGRIRLRM